MSEPLCPSRIDEISSRRLRDDPIDEPDIFTAPATYLQNLNELAPLAHRHKLFFDRFSKVTKELLVAVSEYKYEDFESQKDLPFAFSA